MPDNRYFYPGKLEGTLCISGDEMRHMTKVMRREIGDEVHLVNGEGFLAKARIEKIEKKGVFLNVVEVFHEPESSKAVILAQGLPRLSKLDFIIEKGTELGATEFWLFPAEKSEKKELTQTQQQRLQTIAISALKQSGRLYLPKILIKEEIVAWEKLPFATYFGEMQAEPLSRTDENVCMVIGPEKGFSDNEKKHLLSLQAAPKSLNKNVLRTETAAICALSLLS